MKLQSEIAQSALDDMLNDAEEAHGKMIKQIPYPPTMETIPVFFSAAAQWMEMRRHAYELAAKIDEDHRRNTAIIEGFQQEDALEQYGKIKVN